MLWKELTLIVWINLSTAIYRMKYTHTTTGSRMSIHKMRGILLESWIAEDDWIMKPNTIYTLPFIYAVLVSGIHSDNDLKPWKLLQSSYYYTEYSFIVEYLCFVTISHSHAADDNGHSTRRLPPKSTRVTWRHNCHPHKSTSNHDRSSNTLQTSTSYANSAN